MDDEEEDDPFSRGFDDGVNDEDEGQDLGDDLGSSEDEDMEGMEDETSDTDMSEDGAAAAPKPGAMGSMEDRAELLKAVAKDQKAVASSLAQSTKADAEKGRAVKKQKAGFDSLLNSRIKLQKTLVGSNTIVGISRDDAQAQIGAVDAVEAAENAAFALWSSLNSFRDEMIAARTGEKRKRSKFGNDTPTGDLWRHMQSQEESCLPHRNVTLNRWAVKARGATTLPERGVISRSAQQSTLVDALQEHLSNRDRLLAKAHTPRSCAPLQLANGVTEDDKVYDDADFYGIMLKELLERKSEDSVAASNIDLNFNVKREAKAKKNVDTKASKGRKLRYTVHEKLQNFMAPEDRSTWSERQADELFGSLFGRRVGLGDENEDHEDAVNGTEEEDVSLKLFRS